ncbi:uncharacterized protein At4g38062-like [Andrographis paniculata]|uniref:uncharacterized protein At4g38062-like n=1 Tax=Andrographis paniculata TaxID=175694 RepID=UPI0021E74F50|nr:uncharacterized protein At4g38062-like [Andrographis paniculata]XP_051143886.1 uncharacterized protein At4g38062-like [Andrographis paniculata]XP_051143887.1 uncharacterized protein At4g38062-like [Andrographis paniculata]XP_051143888.1 uncharacterized protein At4g38062-like [Andrographis paniculata]XP_051143889.1 uncharacterized protein At4g38062-like [Andrographis paniculata]XP_051143890.1 uncharacterized protein At4g38062-like [Andrographis paniculata]XP_051143891.1 uncharacterized prot
MERAYAHASVRAEEADDYEAGAEMEKEDLLLARVRLEEEERSKFEDELKWKKEQFNHLEEAHKRLQDEFKSRHSQWDHEKSALLDAISSLQDNLESQKRISQDLQGRLEMCDQALAHAETKKRSLEAQLMESRTRFEDVCVEYEEAKLSFDNLTCQRDEEIATLRSSLRTKEILHKEMEYQLKKVEQENQELLASLKQLREAQIRGSCFSSSSSSSKLQRKLKSLEEVHRGCSTKEAEWHARMEELSDELYTCRLELKSRDALLNELYGELEACHSLKLQLEFVYEEETKLILLVLKSQLAEAEIKQANNDLKNKEKITKLVEEMQSTKDALTSVEKDLEDERERVIILLQEVERLEKNLQESTAAACQGHLEKVRATEELYERWQEADEIKFELQEWKCMAQQLAENLKQKLEMRREVEASLLAEMEVELNLKVEKESLCTQLEGKEKRIECLLQQLAGREEEIQHLQKQLVAEKSNIEETCSKCKKRRNLMPQISLLLEKMEDQTREDKHLMERMMNNIDDDFEDSVKENTTLLISPSTKTKMIHDDRSPLRTLNT